MNNDTIPADLHHETVRELRAEITRLRGLLGEVSIEMNRRHAVVDKSRVDAILGQIAAATEAGR